MQPATNAAQRWAALEARVNRKHLKRLRDRFSGRSEESLRYIEALVDMCERFGCEFRDPGGSAHPLCHKRLDNPKHTCQYRMKDHSLEELVEAELDEDQWSFMYDHEINVWWPENGAYGILAQPYCSKYKTDQTYADTEIAVHERLGYKVTKIHPSPYGAYVGITGSERLMVAFLITGSFAPPVELHDDPFVVLENKETAS